MASLRRVSWWAVLVALCTITMGDQTFSLDAQRIGDYVLVSQTRLSGSLTLYTYRARLFNQAGALDWAAAAAWSVSRDTVVINPTLAFGPVPAGGSAPSIGTFSIAHKTAVPVDFNDLRWTIVAWPANSPPVVNAGPDQNAALPRGVTLNGRVTDDGRPLPHALSMAWTKRSGPGTVTFSARTRPVTDATFSLPGVYVLRLTATDGALTAFDEATITITSSNRPPTANAGPDQTALIGSVVTLDGTASADPEGSALSFAWSVLSRPAGSSASLLGPGSARPSLTIDVPGTYTIQLLVSDGSLVSAADTVAISTVNSAPVARAGADQTARVTQAVTLDGSGSSDVDGDPLAYAWTLVSRPATSAASLAGAVTVSPRFTVDVPGTYVARLVVNDGAVASAPDDVVITTVNSPPVADAGADQGAAVGSTVTLDGSASSDVDGDPLTFTWALTTVPPGSTATLSDIGAVRPTFVVDRPGLYVAQLVVRDALGPGAPDTVAIATTNTAPIADAGPDQTAVARATITLDGTASSDAESDPLTFAWSLTTRPVGSAAVLAGADTAQPTFIADLPGTYVAQVIVGDGQTTSAPDTVVVSTTNLPPVADAGPDQIGVGLGTVVVLSGAGSNDPNGHPLTYAWSLITRPAGSLAALDDETSPTPSFTPDRAGDYVVQLIVHDGFAASVPDTVLIGASAPPVADAGPDQHVETGAVVTLDGTGSRDPEGRPLAFSWILRSLPTGSTATLTDADSGTPSFTADLTGAYVIDLTVRDDAALVASDTVVVTASVAPPVITIAASDADAGEAGSNSGGFTVHRSGSLTDAVTVLYTIAGTATAGADYAALPGVLTIAAGADSARIDVTPLDDPDVEPGESVSVTIAADAAYTVGAVDTAVVTISSDDVPDVVTVAATPGAELEPTAGAFTFTRTSDAPTRELRIGFTIGGTATSDDVGGDIMTAAVTMPAGTSTVSVAVPVIPDDQQEGDESVVVTLVPGPNYEPGASATASMVITDDPPVITMTAIDPDAAEGGSETGVVRVRRGGAPLARRIVRVTFAGSATFDVDFTVSGADVRQQGAGFVDVELAAGASSTLLTLTPVGTLAELSTAEGQETVIAEAEGAQATVAVRDEPLAVVAVTDAEAYEGPDDPATFQVARGAGGGVGFARPVRVDFSGSAIYDTDYAMAGPDVVQAGAGFVILQIPVGAASTALTLTPLADGVRELPESVIATVEGTVVQALVHDYDILSLPPTLNVPLTSGTHLPIAITRDAGHVGDITVTLTSSHPAIVAIDTPTVVIPAGQISVNALVSGLGLGSATIRASAPGFLADTSTLSTSGHLDITVASLTIGGGPVSSIDVQLESPPGHPVAAPPGGVSVSLTSSDASCVAVPAAAVIGAGLTSVPVQVTYAGTAVLPCAATVTAAGPSGISADTVAVTVAATAGITISPPAAVAGGLQQTGGASLGFAGHGGVTVRVTSGDPTRLLVAPNAGTAGGSVVDVFVPDGSTVASFVVQGLDWVPGVSSSAAVPLTVSAPGFATRTTAVSYVQPGVRLTGVPTSTTPLSANAALVAQVGVPSGTGLSPLQARRAGASDLEVTFTNSQAAVAELDQSGGVGGAQSQSARIPAGASASPSGTGGVEFDPLGTGTTTVTVSIPGFVAASASATAAVTGGPGITLTAPVAVGGGLQQGGSATLGASSHGGVTVHVESSDPSRLLIGANATTPGQASLDVLVPNGATVVTYVVQATDWVPGVNAAGPVSITVSAPGFTDGTATVTYVQPGVRLTGVPATTTALSTNADIAAQVGVPSGTGLVPLQARRAGAPDLVVTFANSNAAVAELDQNGGIGGAQIQTATIGAGLSNTPAAAGGVEFDPLGGGTTTVTASIVGFVSSGASLTSTVASGAGITVTPPAAVAGGLQQVGGATLGASAHGGVTVRVASADPTRLLVAPNVTTVGSPFIDLVVANGTTTFSYVVQATDWVTGTSVAGPVALTVSAPGFTDGGGSVSYVQPGIRLTGVPVTTTVLSANADVIAQVGVPVGNGVSPVQARRAGAPDLVVTFTNANASVAELDQNGGVSGAQTQTAVIAAGQSSTPTGAGGVEFDPLGTGTTTVTASSPGFVPAGASLTGSVTGAGITVTTPATVGGGLQQAGAAMLGAGGHGGVTVRVTSSDPTRLLVAPNATTPGAPFVDIAVVNGGTTVTFTVQGTDWVSGTSSAGTPTITVSAPGFSDGTAPVSYVQPAIRLSGAPAVITAAAPNVDIVAQVGFPTGTGLTQQARRAGAAPIVVTFGSTEALVAELDQNGGTSGAPTQSAVIAPGLSSTPTGAGGVELDPLAPGGTTVTVSAPGFLPVNSPFAVTVTP